jgi:glycerate kinase
MKIIIAPDKFKGSLTSFEVCAAIAAGAKAADENRRMDILPFPMADGGDGFAAVMKHYLHTETRICHTQDPLGRPLAAAYELDPANGVAIVEMASASGLVLLNDSERNALTTSTLGTGLMIKAAIDAGAKKIVLGLGGSATNDAGTGILAALGFRFMDKEGHSLKACGDNLARIATILPPAELPAISFDIACDVQNVLYGPQGAACVYAPQKGAGPADVEWLDNGLRNFAGLISKDIATIPGTGAAGGIAAGLMAFFQVRLSKGIELVISSSGIAAVLPGADLVITGEGKIDKQTLYGKVVSEIASMAGRLGIPVIAFCGISGIAASEINDLKLRSVQAIAPPDMPMQEAMARAGSLLTEKAKAWFIKNDHTGMISP